MIMAQVTIPEATWLWTALLVLSTIGNAAIGWTVISNRPQRNQLLNTVGVRVEEGYVPVADHITLKKELTSALRKVEESHHDLAREVSGLTASMEIHSSGLIEMGRKLDAMRGRTLK